MGHERHSGADIVQTPAGVDHGLIERFDHRQLIRAFLGLYQRRLGTSVEYTNVADQIEDWATGPDAGPAGGNLGGKDVPLAPCRLRRECTAQVPVRKASLLRAAAIHSSRPSMGIR